MMKRKSGSRYIVGGILAFITLVGMGCGNGARVSDSKPATGGDIAVIPDADVVMCADLQGMRDSAIYTLIKDLADNQPDTGLQFQEMEQVAEQLKDITGLEEDDFLTVTFSAVLKGIDFDADHVDARMNAVMAIELAKPLTIDQLEEAINKATETSPDINLAVAREQHAGSDMLAVTVIEEYGEDTTMGVAVTAGGRVVLTGTMLGTKGALDRQAHGVSVSVAEHLELDPKAIPHLALRFDLTDAMQDQMRDKMGDPDSHDPMANSMKAFEGLERVDLKVDMADDMKVAFSMGLGSEEKATIAKNVLDNTVLGMLRMMVGMVSGGQPLTVLESLDTRLDPNGAITLSFTLTPSDIEILQSMNQ